MALSKEQRDRLKETDFAVPSKRVLPIHDAEHAKLAWTQVGRTQGLTPGERTMARTRIMRRAKQFGVDVKDWHIKASLHLEAPLSAMSLQMPSDPHPNKMPFSGILTFVDRASDKAVGGTGGYKVYLPKDVVEAALPSLLGMGVDLAADASSHNAQKKIGIIDSAEVVGDEVRISGFIYASDFPDEAEFIQECKDDLGFSYEVSTYVQDKTADPWMVEACVFTGAAILYKDTAAYTETRLAAQAEEFDMELKDLQKAIADGIGAALAPITASVETLKTDIAEAKKANLTANAVRDKVMPHAEACMQAAAAMEKDGIGLHATAGHVAVLRRMGSSMQAEAAVGKLPHAYHDNTSMYAAADDKPNAATAKALAEMGDKLAAATTELADLKAKGFKAATEPARKTFSPEIRGLLEKSGLQAAAETGTMTVDQVDKFIDAMPTQNGQKMGSQDRIAAKLRLQAAGINIVAAH